MSADNDRVWKPLHVTWALLKERAKGRQFDGYADDAARINAIEGYREEGYTAARCGLEMGLVGYEELHDEEAYERRHQQKAATDADQT